MPNIFGPHVLLFFSLLVFVFDFLNLVWVMFPDVEIDKGSVCDPHEVGDHQITGTLIDWSEDENTAADTVRHSEGVHVCQTKLLLSKK